MREDLAPEEWRMFKDCRSGELELCYWYEYTRASCLRRQLDRSLFPDWGQNEFPEWPVKPYLLIPPAERERRLEQLAGGSANYLHCLNLLPPLGTYILSEMGRRYLEVSPRQWVALFAIDWERTDKEILDDITAWLKEYRPKACPSRVSHDTGAGSLPRRQGAQCFCRLSANFAHKNGAVDPLKTVAGQDYGEWRHGENGGAYSLVYGKHPDDPDVVFQLEGESVPCLDFAVLGWPKDIVLPWSPSPAREYVSPDPAPQTGSADLDARIRAYIDTVEIATEGEGGSTPTYRLACALVHRWALGRDEAVRWMHYYSERRCKPPWTDREIEHKIDDALKATDHRHPYGDLRDAAHSFVGGSPPEGFEGFSPDPFSNPSNPSEGVSQQTPFPEDSILSDYHKYAITQSQGADPYIVGPILPVIGALLSRNVLRALG